MMRRRGVTVFSVSDHDTLDAYDAEPSLAQRAAATVVTGVEINTTYRGNEVHVLGYGVARDAPAFADALAANREARAKRVAEIVRKLNAAGVDLPLDAVLAESRGSSIGRPHVAMALVRGGHVASVDAAFKGLLSRGGPAYVPSLHITPQHAIALIASAGGVSVLAHPGRMRDDDVIDELHDAGLVGLEVFHPSHSQGQVAHFRRRARELGLVMTAGSDFHDRRYNAAGVGVEVDVDDVRPFLDLVT